MKQIILITFLIIFSSHSWATSYVAEEYDNVQAEQYPEDVSDREEYDNYDKDYVDPIEQAEREEAELLKKEERERKLEDESYYKDDYQDN